MSKRANSNFENQIKEVPILRMTETDTQSTVDHIVVEAPLEIQISYIEQNRRVKRSLAITMRTPGTDWRLACGFLFTEGIIGKAADILAYNHLGNTIKLTLSDTIKITPKTSERSFYMHSSCGICGKPTLDSLEKTTCYYPLPEIPTVTASILNQLSDQLRAAQSIFEETGGIHAVGLFDDKGALLHYEEDIGRHNALDKIIGYALEHQIVPMREFLLLLSGRISYELVQKASLVGIPIIVAVGAPSSMAIELAVATDITLIGFLRNNRFNVYSGSKRVIG